MKTKVEEILPPQTKVYNIFEVQKHKGIFKCTNYTVYKASYFISFCNKVYIFDNFSDWGPKEVFIEAAVWVNVQFERLPIGTKLNITLVQDE